MGLAAAVVTAMLVVAVSALDAVGADPPAKAAADVTGKAPLDLTAKLADCLRGRGVAVPALTGTELDHWLRTHRLADADVRACKEAVAPRDAEVRAAPSEGAKQLSECLGGQGFDVPTDPMALKEWIGHQRTRTALGALKACGLVMKPDPGADGKPAPCGVTPAKQPDSSEARRPDSAGVTPEN
jgi:hypothetical protein